VGHLPKEIADIPVIGQGRAESDNPDQGLARLDLTQSSRHDCLDHRTTLFVEQVNFINDQQPNFLSR
jgi:hypothetical protein